MAKSNPTPEEHAFDRAVGADIRAMRMAADVSQESLAELLNWNKDAISKIERGVNSTSFYDYLKLMMPFAHDNPDHPALDLARKYGMHVPRRR